MIHRTKGYLRIEAILTISRSERKHSASSGGRSLHHHSCLLHDSRPLPGVNDTDALTDDFLLTPRPSICTSPLRSSTGLLSVMEYDRCIVHFVHPQRPQHDPPSAIMIGSEGAEVRSMRRVDFKENTHIWPAVPRNGGFSTTELRQRLFRL